MSVCLTGDIHQRSMHSPEQRFSPLSEAQIAEQYLAIAEKFQLKVTLFLTGKCVNEELEDLRKLLNFRQVEFGGHTYSGFRPIYLHRLFKVTMQSFYGPSWYQRRDIERTITSISKGLGFPPVSWRTHGYMSNVTTFKYLQAAGVSIISDEVNPNTIFPHKLSERLWSLAINTLPDHEHLIHADRTQKHVSKQISKGWSDRFTSRSYDSIHWLEQVKNQISDIASQGGIATILAHPLCMFTSDRLASFSRICELLSGYETLLVGEVPNYMVKHGDVTSDFSLLGESP